MGGFLFLLMGGKKKVEKSLKIVSWVKYLFSRCNKVYDYLFVQSKC